MLLYFGKEKQLCCENSVCCLVIDWFYSENIGGIIGDYLLEVNRAIVMYLRNG